MVSLLQQMMVPSLQQMGPFVATTETRFSLGRRQQVLFWGLCEIWASIGSSPTLGQVEPSILKLNSLEQIQGACLLVVMATMLFRRNSGSFTQCLKLQTCWVRVHTNMPFLCKKKSVSTKNWVEVSDKRSTNICSECPQQLRTEKSWFGTSLQEICVLYYSGGTWLPPSGILFSCPPMLFHSICLSEFAQQANNICSKFHYVFEALIFLTGVDFYTF